MLVTLGDQRINLHGRLGLLSTKVFMSAGMLKMVVPSSPEAVELTGINTPKLASLDTPKKCQITRKQICLSIILII